VLSLLEEEAEDARETARVVEAAERTAVAMPGDLQEADHCRALIERAVEDLGGVDLLVNNAAYQMSREGLAGISPEERDRTFRVNILAMFHTCRAALEHMRPGSAIINTASVPARPRRPAGRARPGVRLPGLPGVELRQRRDHPGPGRDAGDLTPAARPRTGARRP